MCPGFLDADEVVIQRLFVRGVFVFAEVDAEDGARTRRGGNARDEGVNTVVVEAHAVDDGLVFGQAAEAWAVIARLRARGNGADFDEAESRAVKGADGDAVFIQPGGEAEAVREGQPQQFDGLAALSFRHDGRKAGKRAESEVVRFFGIKAEK